MADLLVIDTPPQETRNLCQLLRDDLQINVGQASSVEVNRHLEKKSYDAIIFDLPADFDALDDPLQPVRKAMPNTPVIVVSTSNSSDHIVRCIKAGAFDYLNRPFPIEKLGLAVSKAIGERARQFEIDYLRGEQDVVYGEDAIVAVSDSMRQAMALVRKASQSDATVLMTGETGTGKSFIAGHIHFNSARSRNAFINVNCSNLSESLLDSELFGHERGAFTGALKTRVGRFEQAAGGTLFLDEIGEMTPGLQAKLLRALEDKSFERLGGNRTVHADVRIIAATNRDLDTAIATGQFRADLYYRLNVLHVTLPPLRERLECIAPLANHLLRRLRRTVKKSVNGFEPQVLQRFQTYHWPGNVRQLANVIERALLLEEADVISYASLPADITAAPISAPSVSLQTAPESGATSESLEQKERHAIIAALEENLWIQKDAARQLGLSPRALNYRIRKFGITHQRWRRNKSTG